MRGLRLTGRGLALLLAGIIVAVLASAIGEPDLAWVGWFLIGLPLVALAAVAVLRPRLQLSRAVDPPQVPIGSRPRAVLDVSNGSGGSLTAVDFRDRLPEALGSDARFSLVRGPGRWEQSVGYDVRADHRGHFVLGPLEAVSYEPFGLARYRHRVPGDPVALRVTPRVWKLARLKSSVGSGAAGDATPQRIGQAGQDDVLVREHRHGDDLRRVHWRMTAKQGELMVRLEEHPWDPAVTLLVDSRISAHFGNGPDSSLEWCVSIAASVAAEMLASRYRVTILSADQQVFAPGHGDALSASDRMLDALTDLAGTERTSLEEGLGESDAIASAQTIMGALGLLTATDAAALAAVGTRMVQASALVPDAAAWGATVEAADAHRDACRLLTSSGWALHHYRPGERVPDAWSALLARREVR